MVVDVGADMTETVARGLVAGVAAYVAVGVLFALPFVRRGAGVLEPVAREGTWGFRLLIVPGVVTLWPVLLVRWIRAPR
jgi:hypothetical protein